MRRRLVRQAHVGVDPVPRDAKLLRLIEEQALLHFDEDGHELDPRAHDDLRAASFPAAGPAVSSVAHGRSHASLGVATALRAQPRRQTMRVERETASAATRPTERRSGVQSATRDEGWPSEDSIRCGEERPNRRVDGRIGHVTHCCSVSSLFPEMASMM